MELFWRGLDAIHDVLSGAPDPIATAVLIAYPITLLLVWGLSLRRTPRLGIAISLAVVVLAIVEMVAFARAPAPVDPALPAELTGAVFWAGEIVIATLGAIGVIVGIVRVVELSADA